MRPEESAAPERPVAPGKQPAVTTGRPTAERMSRFWPLVSGAIALVLAVSLGAVITMRSGQLSIDDDFLAEIVDHRHPLWDVPSLLMNVLGGGVLGVFIVPLAIIGLLLAARRPWAAGYFLTASVLSALLVQVLKNLFGRARPDEILVTADYGSFPSGHTANAATLAVVLGVVLARAWVWVVGVVYTVLMLLSRTYLGAHWLSDTIGGLLVGVCVALLVWAPFASRLHREQTERSGWGFRRAAS